jgi:hypothetical protein
MNMTRAWQNMTFICMQAKKNWKQKWNTKRIQHFLFTHQTNCKSPVTTSAANWKGSMSKSSASQSYSYFGRQYATV